MQTKTIEAPALYGDHHVTEVRRILFELPGVEDVYASSAFQVIEVTFDPEKTSEEEILGKLDDAGYLGELIVPVESGEATYNTEGAQSFFRHTAAYQQTKQVVSFAQKVSYTGRPLWPCPGMGVIKGIEEEN